MAVLVVLFFHVAPAYSQGEFRLTGLEAVSKPGYWWVAGVEALRAPSSCSVWGLTSFDPSHPDRVLKLLLEQPSEVLSPEADHSENEQKLFEQIDLLEDPRQSYSVLDDLPEDVIIRGQSPPLLPQALRLASQLYPGLLLDRADDVLYYAGRLSSAGTTNWSGHFRGDIAYDSSGLERLGGNLMLSSALPVGLDTEFYYREVELATGGDGDLWNGDVNLIYKLDVHPRYKFRTGAGVNWRDAGGKTKVGANFTYGLDFMVKGPWMVSAVIDWGRLGNDTLFRWRVTTGVVLGRLEVFAGYDDYSAGEDDFNGFLAGAGFWF